MARASGPRAPLNLVSNRRVCLLVVLAAVFATTRVLSIVVGSIVLRLRRPAHHLLAIIHEVIVLSFRRLAVLIVCAVPLETLLASVIRLLVELHSIAIGSVVLPSRVFIHVLALRYRPPVVIRRLHLRHCRSSRVVSRSDAPAVVVHSAHMHIGLLRRGVCVLIPKGR